MSLVGLDVGTTGTKAVVVDSHGGILGESYREYPLHTPKPGWNELDPVEVWSAVRAVLGEAVARAGDADPVRAIGISSQGEAGVALAADGTILARSQVSFDQRSTPQCESWAADFGAERTFEITGQPVHPMYTLPKLIWMRENEPGFAERLWRFLCFEEYVIYQLTGELAASWALASRTMAFDVRRKCWSKEILDAAGFSESIFAPPLPSGTRVAEVKPDVADALGLPAGIVVATAGHDQPCGAFGAGIVRAGVAVDGTGTVECITPAFSEPVLNETMRRNSFCCYPHTVRDLYVTLAFCFAGGSLLRWFRDTLGAEEMAEARRTGQDVYDLIVGRATPGPISVLALPHFAGAGTPYFDAGSKGAFVGLTLGTTRGDLIKALLDSVTFEMRVNLERLDAAGVSIDELRAIGGGAKSPTWLQLKADIFGKSVTALDVTEAPCLGAALCAGLAVGEYASAGEAVAAAVHDGRRYEPDSAMHERYLEKYEAYKALYPALQNLSPRL